MGKTQKQRDSKHNPAPLSKRPGPPSVSNQSATEGVRTIKRRVVIEETEGSEEELLIVKVKRTPKIQAPAKATEVLRKGSTDSGREKQLRKSEASVSSSSEVEVRLNAPLKKSAVGKAQLQLSSSSDSDAPVKGHGRKQPIPSSSSIENEPAKNAKAKITVKPAAKQTLKPKQPPSSSSDSDLPKHTQRRPAITNDSSSEDSPLPKPKASASKAKVVTSSSSDSDVPVFTKKAPKPTSKPTDSEDSLSEEDAKATRASAARIQVESSDEDDEPKLRTKRKASASSQDTLKKVKKGQAPPINAPSSGGNEVSEIYVGSLSWNATEDDVYELFRAFGTIENVKLLYNDQGKSRGNGFVKFANPEDAQAALGANGTELKGRAIRVNLSGDKPVRPPGGEAPSNTVFVRNLSYSTSEDAINGFFARCGTINQVRVSRDFDGNSKGFAHIEFTSQKSAEAAVKLSGQKLEGRQVNVDFAKPRADGSISAQGGQDTREAAPPKAFAGKKKTLQ